MSSESGPEFDEYADHIKKELLPKLKDSAFCLSLVPKGPSDVKFAVELGFCIMLDKPIIAVIRPGTKIPEKLARVVDRFVEYDPDNADDNKNRLTDVLSEMIGEIRKKESEE